MAAAARRSADAGLELPMQAVLAGLTSYSTHNHESTYYFHGKHLIKELIDGHNEERRDFPRMEAFFHDKLRRMH